MTADQIKKQAARVGAAACLRNRIEVLTDQIKMLDNLDRRYPDLAAHADIFKPIKVKELTTSERKLRFLNYLIAKHS